MSDIQTDSPIARWLTANPYWPMKADVFNQLCGVMERHIHGVKLSEDEIASALAAKKTKTETEKIYEVVGSAAVIPVSGVIAKYSSMVNGVSQARGTSVETISAQLAEALGDEAVGSIFLHIESPGGNIAGLPDLADAIFEANEQKPVVAFADDMAASAAYWLGSQAGRFYANQSAEVGSIGVYSVYVDYSRMYENAGVKVIPVCSGKHKATGYPGTAITDEQLEPAQKLIDQYYEMFVAAVVRGRGPRGLGEEKLREVADGRGFLAVEAAELGLIDGVKTFKQAIMGFKPSSRKAMASRKQKETDMTEQQEQVEAASPAELDAIRQKAADGERKRISGIEAAIGGIDELAELREKAVAEGWTAEAAKAAAFDLLKGQSTAAVAARDKEIEALRVRGEKMEKLLGSKGISAKQIEAFDPSDLQEPEKQGGKKAAEAGSDDGQAETYEAAVAAMVEKGAKQSKAYRDAAVKLPESHAAWIEANQQH